MWITTNSAQTGETTEVARLFKFKLVRSHTPYPITEGV